MKYLLRPMIYAILLLVLSACENNEVEQTVWDEQIESLDKAREVEDKLMNRADQLSKDLGINEQDDDEEQEKRPRG